jgi:acetyltransferase-like isoleucine patch superfamily enzyme
MDSTQESVLPQAVDTTATSAVDAKASTRRRTGVLSIVGKVCSGETIRAPWLSRIGSRAMTSMWGAPIHKRWRGSRLRDPRQARFLTVASLKWVIANRAYTPWYLVRYFRLLKFKLANPHIITRGMVFLGKNVEIHATPELAQMEIGRWVHIGDKNTIRAHEGSLRLGDKVVFGRDNVINCYIDIEFGESALMADWCYVCDFDHKMDNIELPIKDQGIVKTPVRIGPDTWIATKVTILRGTLIGRGCVLGAHAVVKGNIPDFSIAVGSPAKVVKNRKLDWETSAAERAELTANLADIERKKKAAR